MKHIKDLCDEAGCRVEFCVEEDDFVVAFYRNLREEWNNANDGAKVGVNGVNDGAKEKDVRVTIIECIKQDERITIAGIATNSRQNNQGIKRREYHRKSGIKQIGILEASSLKCLQKT